jgi:hypothetical protein
MNDEPVEIPVIIEECKMAGCKNAAEINGYLAAEVSRLRFVKKQALKSEIQRVLSLNDAERGSNTPDFVLADYLLDILNGFRMTQNLEVPFNVNLMTHMYRKHRRNFEELNVIPKDIYNYIL